MRTLEEERLAALDVARREGAAQARRECVEMLEKRAALESDNGNDYYRCGGTTMAHRYYQVAGVLRELADEMERGAIGDDEAMYVKRWGLP